METTHITVNIFSSTLIMLNCVLILHTYNRRSQGILHKFSSIRNLIIAQIFDMILNEPLKSDNNDSYLK